MKNERIYLSPPHLSGREIHYLGDVIASNWVAPAGPHLEKFERRVALHTGVKYALAVSSGTAALHLALRHLGIKAGDEVLCSTLTFCASANPIQYENGRPVFIDSDWATWNMDPNLLAEELKACARKNKLPRAVVAVDIFGQSADMDAIVQIAAQYEVPVIEDAAEALGATYKNRSAGASGWAGFFSFNGNKILTAGGGGILCSDDGDLIDHARYLATQARDPAPHYQHSQVGFNYRMSNVLAAIGVAQLEVFDERVQRRREIFEMYQQLLGHLPGITFMPEAPYGHASRWLTVIQIDSEKFGATPAIIHARLEAARIEARPVWKPLHLQPVFSDSRCVGGEVAEEIFRTSLCLPSGTAMAQEDIERVAQLVCSCQDAGRRGKLRPAA